MQSVITEAVFVYNLMKQKGIEVSSEMKQSLLELVCFYNNCEQLSEELIEERWFKLSTAGRASQSSSWKDGELVENLFTEIGPKTSSSYHTRNGQVLPGWTCLCFAARSNRKST